jgi:peptidoglycan/xylan/chitin deacetylase (PgdA/CDA1 family)
MMSKKIPLLWTNDDVTAGGQRYFNRLVPLAESLGLRGTFFIIPCPNGGKKRLTDDPGLIADVKAAMANGHEAHQHSTTHVCPENGTADLRMYDLMGMDAKAFHSSHRFILERLWQVDALEAQIAWGRRVWTDAFGAPSEGFRPGCGAFCGNMYKALANLGFKWTSSRLVSLTGWQWVFGNENYPPSWEGPVRPTITEGVMEFPILDDVAFKAPFEKIDQFVELGWTHWQKCVEKNWPFITVCHTGQMEVHNDSGYRIHEKLFKRILDTGHADPMTLGQYYRAVKAGTYPLADPADAYPGPDAIPEWHVLHPSHGDS